MNLAECRDRVVEVMKHQRHDRAIDRLVAEPVQGVANVVDPKVRQAAHPPASMLDQLGAAIEAHDVGPALRQFGRVQARAAADIQDPAARDVPEKTEHGRTVIVGVVGTMFGVKSAKESAKSSYMLTEAG